MFRLGFAFALVFVEQAKHILSCCCLNINHIEKKWGKTAELVDVAICTIINVFGSEVKSTDEKVNPVGESLWHEHPFQGLLPQSCGDWSLEHFFSVKWTGDELIKRLNALSKLIFYFTDLDILVTFSMSSISITKRFVDGYSLELICVFVPQLNWTGEFTKLQGV